MRATLLLLMGLLTLPVSAAAGRQEAADPPPPASDQLEVPSAALRTLGKHLAGYLGARANGDSVKKDRSRLYGEAAEIASDLGIESLLVHPELLGRAWSMARAPSERRVRKGKVTAVEATPMGFGADPLRFSVWLPKRYAWKMREHALVVVLASGTVGPEDAISVAQELTSGAEADDRDSAGALARERSILISPELPNDPAAWTEVTLAGQPGGVRVVLAAIDEAIARYGVDIERVHLLGFGSGAELALCVADHAPHRFASVTCRLDKEDTIGRAPLPANLRTVPVLFNLRSTATRPYLDDAVARGYDRIVSQFSWRDGGPWDWIAMHTRTAYPTVVTVRPGVSFPTRVHWLAVDSVARDSEATATFERDKQRILVDAKGCGSVRILLNDELIDLRYPIDVIVNGKKTRLSPTREWTTTLDLMADTTSDTGRVYVSEVQVKVPKS